MTESSRGRSGSFRLGWAFAALVLLRALHWLAETPYTFLVPLAGCAAFGCLAFFLRESVLRDAEPDGPPVHGRFDAGILGVLLLLGIAHSAGPGHERIPASLSALAVEAAVLISAVIAAIGYRRGSGTPRNATHPFSGFPLTDGFVGPAASLFVVWAIADQVLRLAELPAHFKTAGVLTAGYAVILAAAIVGLPWLGLTRAADPKRRFSLFVVSSLLPAGVIGGLGYALAWVVRWWVGAAWTQAAIVGLGWALAAPALGLAFASWSVARHQTPGGRRERGEDVRLDAFRRHLTRTQLLFSSILRDHAGLFFVTLPLSVLLSLFSLLNHTGLFGGVHGFTVASAWVGATLAWSGQILHRLFFLEDSYARAHAADLHRVVQALRGHVLIVGYGALGRRLLIEQLQKKVIPYRTMADHVDRSRNILMPSGRLAKIFSSVAVVDDGGGEGRNVVRTPEGASLAVAEVGKALQSGADREPAPAPAVEYVVPMVVGDPGDAAVLEGAAFDYAAFLLCAVEEQDGAAITQRILQRLTDAVRRRPIPAAMTIHTSTLAPYITQRVVDYALPVHYVFPEHLEGLQAANVLHAAVMKLRKAGGPWPSILICGRGKRAFYLIDSFLRNLSADEFASLAHAPGRVMLLGYDDELKSMSRSATGTCKSWIASTGLADTGLHLGELTFSRLVGRSPSAGGDPPWHPAGGGPLTVPLVLQDPQDVNVCRILLGRVWPDILVFSDLRAEDELRAVHAMVNAVTTQADEAPNKTRLPLPAMIVSAETGDRHDMRNYENALVYYSSLHDTSTTAGDPARYGLFPAPGLDRRANAGIFRGDTLVDVLDDPVQRMSAVLRAYGLDGGRAEGRIPLELNVCAGDQAGVVATALARLGGQQPTPPDEKHKSFPSLTNSKIIQLHDGRFLMKSFGYLSPRAPLDDPRFSRLSVIGGHVGGRADGRPPAADDVGALGRIERLLSPDGAVAASVARHRTLCEGPTKGTLRTWMVRVAEHAAAAERQTRTCCGMVNCPIEAVHKMAASSTQTIGAARIRDDGARRRHAQALLRHFVFDDTAPVDHLATAQLPYAAIAVKCRDADRTGTLATAVNALLFRTLTNRAMGNGWVFNATYMSSYECHDERFAVFTCYGSLLQQPAAALNIEDVLERVEIKPIRHADAWLSYARELLGFLGDNYRLDEPDAGSLLGRRFVIAKG